MPSHPLLRPSRWTSDESGKSNSGKSNGSKSNSGTIDETSLDLINQIQQNKGGGSGCAVGQSSLAVPEHIKRFSLAPQGYSNNDISFWKTLWPRLSEDGGWRWANQDDPKKISLFPFLFFAPKFDGSFKRAHCGVDYFESPGSVAKVIKTHKQYKRFREYLAAPKDNERKDAPMAISDKQVAAVPAVTANAPKAVAAVNTDVTTEAQAAGATGETVESAGAAEAAEATEAAEEAEAAEPLVCRKLQASHAPCPITALQSARPPHGPSLAVNKDEGSPPGLPAASPPGFNSHSVQKAPPPSAADNPRSLEAEGAVGSARDGEHRGGGGGATAADRPVSRGAAAVTQACRHKLTDHAGCTEALSLSGTGANDASAEIPSPVRIKVYMHAGCGQTGAGRRTGFGI